MTKNPGMNGQLRDWVIAKSNPLSVAHVGLSAMAAVVSYLIARRLRLPEACWAPMSTLIVMQSTLSAALPIAVQYVAGSAGRSSRWCHHRYLLPGKRLGVRCSRLLCVALRVERSA